MANFPPLKNYILYCLDKIIDSYGIEAPFLDVGCGVGDVSVHLAKKGFSGIALDMSDQAFKAAKNNLQQFNDVTVENMSLFEMEGSFKTLLAMDVIEHIENDTDAFNKIASLIEPQGHLILSVPTNPREWRWDDDFYGHVRRYDKKQLSDKLISCGFEVVEVLDFTFPVFWMMRRMYTRIKKTPEITHDDALDRTKESSLVNSWDIPLISGLLSGDNFIWRSIYKIQYSCFRRKINRGHEAIFVARKTS